VKIDYIDSETITPDSVKQLAKFDAILVPGGFGIRGVEGKICAARFARENKVPYLGICLGMQVATIEFARHVAGLTDANSTEFAVKIDYIDSETITPDSVKQLAKFDAILVPGGFGIRGVEGKICAARFARENKVPYLGICLGMQVATIEFARHVAGLTDANSTEFAPNSPNPVIALITEWKDEDGSIKTRDQNSDLGGTMRLGAQSSDVVKGTLAHKIYGDVVTERHRHRYEANVHFLDTLRKAGLVISALTQREQLTEIVELPQNVHPWFMGVQFHPEFKSTPWDGHPLFNAFVKAALDHQTAGKNLKAVA